MTSHRPHSCRPGACALALLLAVLLVSCRRSAGVPTTVATGPSVTPASSIAAPVAPAAAVSPGLADADQTTWWNDAVFYEVFVRSFSDSNSDGIGDLVGLIDKLDYLNDGDPATSDDLGVTGIWLMPVAQSPSYHGYDSADYYTVEQDYGSNADFQRLIDAAHQRGIKVIVDLVLNHTSVEHPWFVESASDPSSAKRDWYIWRSADDGSRAPWLGGGPVWHKWGDAYYFGLFWAGMPDLNYRNPAVTAEMQAVARFWLEEMRVDGFRMDAVRHLVEEGQVYSGAPATHEWLVAFDDFIDTIDPEALTVGEVWDTTAAVAPYVRNDEVDLAFEFDLAQGILASVQRGVPLSSAQELAQTLVAYPPGQFATFLTNHDQNRVATTLLKDPEGHKLAATALLTLPGVPFIYYGEEIGMTGAKPDEKLRTPMQWTGGANAGFTAGKPWQAVNADAAKVNVAAQEGDPDSLLSHYRRLIHLRNEHPALRRGEFTPLDSSCPTAIAYLRHLPPAGPDEIDGQTALVVLNLAREGRQADCTFSYRGSLLPAGVYQAQDLLAGNTVAPLTVAADGFQGYAPTPSLPAQTSYILLLDRQPQR